MIKASSHQASLVTILHDRAEDQPHRQAVTFLAAGEPDERTPDYAALDERARALGAALQERNMAGERALLIFPPSLDYVAAFFGCLYGGAIAVPVYPPD